MKMIQVKSDAINAIGYDPDSMKMKIEFQQGNIYDFCRVPEQVYKSFISAASIGGYYKDYIKDKYPC